jgi:hypothetical protein
MLSRLEGPDDAARPGIIYYVVVDLPAADERLRARGVEFLDTPHREGGRVAMSRLEMNGMPKENATGA